MRILSILILVGSLWLFNGTPGSAQHYIGMHKDEVIQTMKDSQKRLKLNTSVVNPHYNYLKFEDRINEITILFFLSDKDICTNIRETYSYANLTDVIDSLNDGYTSDGKDCWRYIHMGQDYKIELKEKEWYFTVSTRLDE